MLANRCGNLKQNVIMKKLTANDLRDLKHGDCVFQFKGIQERKLHFVGLMPNCKNYLIFCEGEHLEFLYINEKTNEFKYDWYLETLSSEEIGKIIISKIDDKIQSLIEDKKNVKEIYFKNSSSEND